jgi:transketolase
LADKYRSFGWYVLEIDGHNFEEIIGAFRHARAVFEKPTVIIAHTIPGKGVDFIESNYHWHGKVPDGEQAEHALRELRTLQGKIRSEHE